MKSEHGTQSYRVALETAQADLNEIRAKMDQLASMRERIEKATEALKLVISLHEEAGIAGPQPVTEMKPAKEAEGHRNANEPLFAAGFRPMPHFTEAPVLTGSELRPLAALA
jgi:hypothetical protein